METCPAPEVMAKLNELTGVVKVTNPQKPVNLHPNWVSYLNPAIEICYIPIKVSIFLR